MTQFIERILTVADQRALSLQWYSDANYSEDEISPSYSESLFDDEKDNLMPTTNATNMQYLAKAREFFNAGSLEDCERLLSRINKSFAIDNDEYSFEIDCQIHRTMKGMAEQLIVEGKGELVGDAKFRVEQGYLKKELRARIQVRSKFPYGAMVFEELGEDGEDEALDLFFNASFRLDEDGICSANRTGGTICQGMYRECKRVIEKWLAQEFGADMEYRTIKAGA
jgi:hypothetical protein